MSIIKNTTTIQPVYKQVLINTPIKPQTSSPVTEKKSYNIMNQASEIHNQLQEIHTTK